MPWTSGRRSSVFDQAGPTIPTPTGSGGGGFTGGGGGTNKNYDEFVTGPFMRPPPGANVTGTSSLQRAFPERIGGDAFQQAPGDTSLFAQAIQVPGRIAAQPLAIADTITGGGINEFLTKFSERNPNIGGALGAAAGAIETVFSVPNALMNQSETAVMSALWNAPRNAVITEELLRQYGGEKVASINLAQFRKNGWALLGLLGITGDQMTVGDLQDELKDRNFLKDPHTYEDISWSEWASLVNDGGFFGEYSMGHANVNEHAVTDFALMSAGQIAGMLATGGAFGAARGALGLGKGAKAVIDSANGLGKVATAAGKTKPWWSSVQGPMTRAAGTKVGDGLVREAVADGVIKPVASSIAKGAAELAAGDATGMSIGSLGRFMTGVVKAVTLPNIIGGVKAVTLPDIAFGGKTLNWAMRYQIGQTRLRATMWGVEEGLGYAQDELGIELGPLSGVHEWTRAVMNNEIVSDDAVFETAALFAYPFKAGIKDVVRPISSPVSQALGRTYKNLGNRALHILENDLEVGLGKGAIERMGGRNNALQWMDRVAQDIAFERKFNGLPEGTRAKWENAVEANMRMFLINTSVRAAADFYIRRGEITAHQLVSRFRAMHENPTISFRNPDGSVTRRSALPYTTRLSNDAIIERANRYLAAMDMIQNPLVGTHTAVLSRASRLTTEDLDLAISAAKDAALDGTLDAQFVRDLFWKTPGLLDDVNLSEQAHEWFVKVMNPAHNARYTTDEIIGNLKNLKDVTSPRDQVWREMSQRDALAAGRTEGVHPPGEVVNGVALNIHSVEAGRRFQVEADGVVRVLQSEKKGLLEQYRGMFSKRGNFKRSMSDKNWQAEGPNITAHMAGAEVGNFSVRNGVERGYVKGFDVPMQRLGIIPEGDIAGLESAARAIRNNPDFKGANVRLTPSADTPGFLDVTASWHFPNRAAAEVKAAELGVDVIFDSSKMITPRPTHPVAPIPKAVMDAKVTEIASEMGLVGEQATAGAEILRAMAEAHVRNNGGSPIDYLNQTQFIKGGKRGKGALFQTEIEPYLNSLERYGMGPRTLRELVTPGKGTTLLPKGKMTLGDAWVVKLQGIHPDALTASERTSFYRSLFEAQTRPAAGEPVDAFRRAVFSMLSPSNNLTNNEIGLAALGIRTFSDIVKIAKSSPDEVIKKIKAAKAGKRGIGKGARRIIALTQRLVKDPTVLDIRPGELPGAYLTRISSENGFNMKTANFMAMLADPAGWSIGTVDVHIVRSMIEGELSRFLKPGELDPALLARYKARKARSKKKVYPQPSGRTIKGAKVYEGSDYQKFAEALDIALSRKYPDAPFGTGGKQWMAWDQIRNRIEPHTAVWPGTSNLPRLTAEELRAAKAVHTDANYMARGAVGQMEPNAVFFQTVDGPARGMVRLYRGEGGKSKSAAGGKWFSASQDVAREYGAQGQPLKYVDVPKAEAAKYRTSYEGNPNLSKEQRAKIDSEYLPGFEEYRLPPKYTGAAKTLEQRPSIIKGSIEFPAGSELRSVIRAYEAADFPTLMHEIGHKIRRELHVDDQAIAAKHYGVKPEAWSRKAEERFAQDFERYMRDGKAPTLALENVFAKISNYMRNIYKVLKGSPLEARVSPEIKAIFDRSLGRVDEAAAIKLNGPKIKPTPTVAQDLGAASAALLKRSRVEGGATWNPYTGEFVTGSGYMVEEVVGTFRKVGEKDVAGFTSAVNDVVKAYPDSHVGTWLSEGEFHIGPSSVYADVEVAMRRGFELKQEAVWDAARGVEIAIPKTKAALETEIATQKEALQPIRFQQEDAALRLQREDMRSKIHEVDRRLNQTRQEIKDVRTRVAALKRGNNKLDESWEGYDSNGSPKTNYADVKRVEQYVNDIRQNFPEYEVVAGPRIMNLYNPDTNVVRNLMIENDATAHMIYSWGPVSRMSNAVTSAIDRWLRPVFGRGESSDIGSRIYEVMMGLGAERREVDAFLESINDSLLHGRTFGLGKGERVPLTRGMNAMGASDLSNLGAAAFGANKTFVKAFQKRFGGEGMERAYVAITEAYNPAIRAIQRRIEQGGPNGRLARLYEGGYDFYHTAPGFANLAAGTHTLAKFLYPLLRFAANPMYHVYNATESDIMGMTMDGLRVARRGKSSPYASEVFNTLEQGNVTAKQAWQLQQRKTGALGMDTSHEAVDALIHGVAGDAAGATFGINTRRNLIIENQMDIRRVETIEASIRAIVDDDVIMAAARKRHGGSVDDWVNGLTEDIYGLDSMGAKKYVRQKILNEGWTQAEYKAMQPLVDQIELTLQSQFDDLVQIHVGNINRSRLERVVNSYWLYWPASYMLKANKWMFKVLTEGAFGKKTGLGGAWALNELADFYHNKYVTNPTFRKLVDDNKDLEFALSQVLPVVPWSNGVSLNRLTRYTGGMFGMWPQYANFDPTDWASWGKKMSDIGPLYSIGLGQSVLDNVSKDLEWQGGPGGLWNPEGLFAPGGILKKTPDRGNPLNVQGL